MVRANGQEAQSETPFFDVRLETAREAHFVSPQAFTVGQHQNAEGENLGSLAILAYAIAGDMSRRQALELFGEHYEAVLMDPLGSGHQNIRALMKVGTDDTAVEQIVELHDYGISISLIEGWWEDLPTVTSKTASEDLHEEIKWVLQYIEDGVLVIPSEDEPLHWVNKALQIAEVLELYEPA